MHPAKSVIVFTSMSGAGYGLLAFLGLYVAIGLIPSSSWLGIAGAVLALILITGGLLASTAHLGHPERAWRALSQWRSSWLSREGVFAILTYPPAMLFLIGRFLPDQAGVAWSGWGLLAGLLALVTVYSTGKIYATLKTVPQWNSGQVVPAYLVIGLLGGSFLVAALAALFGEFREAYAWVGLTLAFIAGILKSSYWQAIGKRPSGSTSATATGLGGRGERVRLLDGPSTSETFVMREMGYQVARKHTVKLRQIAILSLFGFPTIDAILAIMGPGPLVVAAMMLLGVVSIALGTVIERWLFFAEARHVVTLYHGAETA